jgi:cell division protein FtsI (penicillin-binding protein 3)
MERRNSGNFLNVRYWSCCMLLRVLVVSGFCCILLKAFRLQVIEHQVWMERNRAQVGASLEVPSYRGTIYDRQGRLLSYSVPQRSLFANCDQIESPMRTAASLAPILGESQESLEKRLACGRRFIWLKRHLSDVQTLAVENLKGRGLNLVNEYKRFYPYGQVAGQILGFVGLDGAGLEGIEKAFDGVLRKQAVSVEQLRDGVRKCLWLGADAPPEPAESLGVKLSIDAFLQYLCERELEKAVMQYHAKAGEVVLVDPETFEVLAMANWPFFDPNLSDKKSADSWRNRAVTDAFEPGSTFKVFLVGAALDQGMIKEKDRIFCENGKYALAGHVINDVHPYGWLTIPEVIKYSSNIAASKIAAQLGSERYYGYIQSFGFGKLTGIAFPGEAKGLVRPWKRWRPIDLATTGFGQSLGVTALQLTLGIASIAKGGEYYEPIMAKEVLDSQGKPTQQFHPKLLRRAIQRKTAERISAMMALVTQDGGTGVKAAPDGYTVAGKTGTAQVLDRETRRYATHKYTSIFTGFVPAEKPRLVMSVVIHEPHGAIYGGVVAGPVFRNIAAKALPYLGTLPADPGSCPPPGPRMVKAEKGVAPNKVSSPDEKSNKSSPVAVSHGASSSSKTALSAEKNKTGPPKAVKGAADGARDTVQKAASSRKTENVIATSRRDASRPPIAN